VLDVAGGPAEGRGAAKQSRKNYFYLKKLPFNENLKFFQMIKNMD
jgi:hypothetical protein